VSGRNEATAAIPLRDRNVFDSDAAPQKAEAIRRVPSARCGRAAQRLRHGHGTAAPRSVKGGGDEQGARTSAATATPPLPRARPRRRRGRAVGKTRGLDPTGSARKGETPPAARPVNNN